MRSSYYSSRLHPTNFHLAGAIFQPSGSSTTPSKLLLPDWGPSIPTLIVLRTSQHSALKVVKSASRYAETARDEIKLLRAVQEANPSHPGHKHVVSLLDSFHHCAPEDIHVCIVFEPLGENLLALIERNNKTGIPVALVKIIMKQVLLGLQYLHEECDLVHTDIKPENISESPEQDTEQN